MSEKPGPRPLAAAAMARRRAELVERKWQEAREAWDATTADRQVRSRFSRCCQFMAGYVGSRAYPVGRQIDREVEVRTSGREREEPLAVYNARRNELYLLSESLRDEVLEGWPEERLAAEVSRRWVTVGWVPSLDLVRGPVPGLLDDYVPLDDLERVVEGLYLRLVASADRSAEAAEELIPEIGRIWLNLGAAARHQLGRYFEGLAEVIAPLEWDEFARQFDEGCVAPDVQLALITKQRLGKNLGVVGKDWFEQSGPKDFPEPVWAAPSGSGGSSRYVLEDLLAAMERIAGHSLEVGPGIERLVFPPDEVPPWAEKR